MESSFRDRFTSLSRTSEDGKESEYSGSEEKTESIRKRTGNTRNRTRKNENEWNI